MTRTGKRGSTVGVGGAVTGTNLRLVNLFAALEPARSLEPAEAPEDLTWQDQALCAQVDPEIFFPEKGGSTRDPKRVCRACEVRAECLEYALEHDERFGVWGGLSERERRRLKHIRSGLEQGSETSSSRFPGVSWNGQLGKWQARTVRDGRRVRLGVFADEEEAARAVTEAENTQPRKATAA